MTTILDRITADTRLYVESCKKARPLDNIKAAAEIASPPRGFLNAMKATLGQGRYALIAEIKKASPSAGLIRPDFNPALLAKAYCDAGATCLSILTDRPYFQGDDLYLQQAREAVALPCLRKDFMVDPYQIYESRALGADCILLIMASLSDQLAADLEGIALELGMDVLVETHNEEEMQRALKLRSPLLGINNRNLKIMKTDLAVTEELVRLVPPSKMIVSESGLRNPDDLARMAALGVRSFLIGESLMRQEDVRAATEALLTLPRVRQ